MQTFNILLANVKSLSLTIQAIPTLYLSNFIGYANVTLSLHHSFLFEIALDGGLWIFLKITIAIMKYHYPH